ncbi:MarR family winged helix-turn-helix transcriptional regulator [Pseudactinotalea sp. HY158]|uniref:MarR family winged helix-turn-helix transcriptional regulator n=1 Tax=Pseudactinotalea sp. HY158 TaxID=2654547 RepID=UPI00129C213D|nr:MarR family winged helix-turn-helix transcriptional regulator [Pseudactinotalea sp. HY158]QGH69052.1 MarR family transcriptional regulator [Pseudactinotalea sp. HY158]
MVTNAAGAGPGTPTPQTLFDAHPGRHVAAEFHRLDATRRVVERQASLTRAERRLLWLLADGRPRTFREIAEELGLEQSTVNRQVNGAAADGLVESIEIRPRQVRPSDAGLRSFTGSISHQLDTYEAALARFDPADRENFTSLLGQFVAHYAEAAADAEAARDRPPRAPGA